MGFDMNWFRLIHPMRPTENLSRSRKNLELKFYLFILRILYHFVGNKEQTQVQDSHLPAKFYLIKMLNKN